MVNSMIKKCLANIKENISYIDLITYFLTNFKKISLESLASEFQSKIFDISDTPEYQAIPWVKPYFSGLKSHSFIFREDGRFDGFFDLDFIDDTVVNFRAQLFAKGLFASRKMSEKYDSVLEFITDKHGKGSEELSGYGYDKTWHDENRGLLITFRKVKESSEPSISFAIVDERLAY